ncbi:cyclin-domain-containing protein [Melampsora americana]|nr:cyclin-domain-containing protein [Melampsora americana]
MNNLNKSTNQIQNQTNIKSTSTSTSTPTHSSSTKPLHSPFNQTQTIHQTIDQTQETINPNPSSVHQPQTLQTKINHQTIKELPSQFEKCETDDLIELIASMLNRLISHNDRIPLTSDSLTRFHSRSPPLISIQDYLNRILKYINLEPICILSILPYIDRICEKLANFTICSLTVHRFSITAVTVSSKFLCDSFYANSRYAKVGGIGLVEMNLLEREFLIAIDYRLITTGEDLNRYYLSLVQSHSSYTLLPTHSDHFKPSISSTTPHSIISTQEIENPKDLIECSIEKIIKPNQSQWLEKEMKGEVEECEVEEIKEVNHRLESQPLPDCIDDEEMS